MEDLGCDHSEGESSQRAAGGVGGANDGEGFSQSEGVANKIQKPAIGLDGNDVKGNEDCGINGRTNHILIVGVEDAEVVLLAVVGGGGDDLETLRDKPSVDLGLSDGDQVESRLGDAEGKSVLLDQNAFEAVEARGDEILEAKTLQIFKWGGFPEMKPSGVLSGGNQCKVNAWIEPEDAATGDFEEPISLGENVVLLPAANEARGYPRAV